MSGIVKAATRRSKSYVTPPRCGLFILLKSPGPAALANLHRSFGAFVSRLPNRTRVFADHALACFASESFRELRHVGYRTVDAPSGRRVRIAEDLQTLCFGCRLCCPHLRPSEEEALGCGK